MDAIEKRKLGAFVKKQRGTLSQRQFAIKIGVSYYAVNQWEIGAASPSPENLRKLAEACNCTVDEIWQEVKGADVQLPYEYQRAEDLLFLARQLSLIEHAKLIKLLSESMVEKLAEKSKDN